MEGLLIGLGVICAVVLVLGIIFGINWLITKGVILVMLHLFNIDWSNKFWYVFLFLILLSAIFKGSYYYNRKGE